MNRNIKRKKKVFKKKLFYIITNVYRYKIG